MTCVQEIAWGARLRRPAGVEFRLWAPAARSVDLVLLQDPHRIVPMSRDEGGWYTCTCERASAGTGYLFEINSEARVPDPASRFQPDGINGPSEVIDPTSFEWPADSGLRPTPAELVFYELHVGTFTEEGTYAAAGERLDDLVEIGVNAIELMPLAQAAGTRSWGYDGVLMYAPSVSYGRPEDLKRFIAAAHARHLAVFLDVVYNHFGPEGNYLHLYAPQFFTDRHTTPWGAAIDYTSPGNDPVRAFAIDNACYWLNEYRFDGLRLDATDQIFDERPLPILEELAQTVKRAAQHRVYLVVENDENRVDLLEHGYDAQWNDDVHHALHEALTGEDDGYYRDFAEKPSAWLARALTSGYAYQGESSPFRGGRLRGTPSTETPLTSFINFIQNHDQVGNRAFGERISTLVTPDALHAALAVLLLAPSPPLIFMGEEWGASTPFLYFSDFEGDLARAVREGRRREFARFKQFSDEGAREQIPDPGAVETFERTKLRWSERTEFSHRRWLWTYGTLLELRRLEIAPRVAGVSGKDASYELRGARGLCAIWNLPTGNELRLDANLGSREQAGFERYPAGRTIYTTHGERFAGGIAPPWSVRWSMT
jgi:maltooligosyltrehalose trehalohydrolase